MAKRLMETMLVACASLLLVASGWAQQKEGDRFTFHADLRGEYTDNRDASPDGESSLDFYVVPRGDVFFNAERLLLNFYYSPTYVHRGNPADTQNRDQFFHDVALDLTFTATPRLSMRLFENYSYTDDPSVEVAGATLRRDSSFSMNRAEAGLKFDVSRRMQTDFSVKSLIKRYDEDLRAQENDQTATDAQLVALRLITATMGIAAVLGGGIHDYGDAPDFDRGYNTGFLGLGLQNTFTPKLKGSAKAGVQYVKFSDSTLDAITSPYFTATLRGSTIPSSRITASATYMVSDANIYPYAAQWLTEYYLAYDWDVSKHWLTGVGGLYRIGKYETDLVPRDQNTANAPQAAGSGDERTIALDGKIGYRFDETTSLTLSHRYEDVDTDVAVSFRRNTTALALSKAF